MYEYTIEDMHKLQLKMLRFFDDFCLKNGLRYSLWAGTLLGAVRHSGFIPWDDDVDVIMPRSDYERLIELFSTQKNSLDDNSYELFHYKNQKTYYYPFAKLSFKKTILIEENSLIQGYGCFIDIFPADSADNCYKFRSSASRTFFYLQYLRLKPFKKNSLFELPFKILSSIIPLKLYPRIIDFFAKKKNGSNKNIAVFTHRQLANKRYSFKDVFETKRIMFSELNLLVPKKHNLILEKMYGDWMTPPPSDERIGKHSSHCYDTSKKNVLIILDGCIGHGGQFMCMKTIVDQELSNYSFDFLQTLNYKSAYSLSFINELKSKGCSIYSIQNKGLNENTRQFKNILANKKYDVIHFNMGRCLIAYSFIKSKTKNNARLVFHSHTNGRSSKLLNRLFQFAFVRPKLRKYGDCFLACSEDAGESMFGKRFFKNKGSVLNNAINSSMFHYSDEKRIAIREKIAVEKDMILIGHVGRFSNEKNQELIVNTVQELITRGCRNVRTLLIGDGIEQERIQNIVVEKKIESYFVFLGAVDNVYDYLNAMDVFLFPSKYEGFGLAALEAQTNGLICICSPGISKKVGITPNVIFAKTFNPKEWADILCDLLKKNKLKRTFYYDMIDSSGFSINSLGPMIERIYNKE